MATKNNSSKLHPVYVKAAKGEWIGHADIAKLIRSALDSAFPETKFSVTTKTYSGGGSVSVRWTDGPTGKAVEAVTNQFETRSFDGMIDLAHDCSLWIYPDGSAHVAHDSGTTGSRGVHSEVIESPKDGSAVLLENVCGAYIHCNRSVTARAFVRAIAEYRAQNWSGCESVDWSQIEIKKCDFSGGAYLASVPSVRTSSAGLWLDSELNRLAFSYDLTAPEPEPEPFAEPASVPTHVPCLCW
jgi:hypothetical protein